MQLIANISLLFTERPLLERIPSAVAAGFDGGEPSARPSSERRSNFVEAAIPVAVAAESSAGASSGWSAELETPTGAVPVDHDFDDDDSDLDIPDFLK